MEGIPINWEGWPARWWAVLPNGWMATVERRGAGVYAAGAQRGDEACEMPGTFPGVESAQNAAMEFALEQAR